MPIKIYRRRFRVSFILPDEIVFLVSFLAAVFPAFFLMWYIYRKDTAEKEPPKLLFSLAVMGIIAAVAAGSLGYRGEKILSQYVSEDNPAYPVLYAFLVVAVIEEGAKFILLKFRSWRSSDFNFRFDGIVYSVFVSLGFAATENIGYVLDYGISVAFPRALLAVPGHMCDAVFMGFFYGRAKMCESNGNDFGKYANLVAGYLSAVLLHGFYDSCLMVGTVLSVVLFAVFIVIMYIAVILLIKRESATDKPV